MTRVTPLPITYPGKTMGFVGLALAVFFNVIGLIVSIIAFRRSRAAGFRNRPALIGIVVGALFLLISIISLAAVGALIADVVNTCGQLGTGVREVDGSYYHCS